MIHLKLTIAYDGTGLVGWQRQPTGTSVQGLLEDALAALEPSGVAVTGAGRTDAGVHALAQVASATLRRSISPDSVVRAVNMRLPPSVRVLRAEETPQGFHARFDAVSKTYRYRIANQPVASPFERLYAWHIPAPQLDEEAMAAAAARVVGRHDFAAFQGSRSHTTTTVRTVSSSRVEVCRDAAGDRVICYEVCGDGFLRHMVRSIAGSLVAIGRGRRPPEWIDELLTSGRRSDVGRTAPACGLFLVGVAYE
ncbi:MAG: tRNA pseudouridine(38-40) synthase TruA [Vicinamibacterales bacterium]